MTTEDDPIRGRGGLLAAGFGEPGALALASAQNVDLHALLDLIDSCCLRALAARIAAPLDIGQDCSDLTSSTSESCSSRQAAQPSR